MAPLRRMKDPTKAGRLIRQNERRLVSFFRDYKEQAVRALHQSARHLAAPEPGINFDLYAASLPEIFAEILKREGKEITDSAVEMAYMQGLTFADLALKRVNITASIQAGPIDWRAMDVLKVRNLTALRGIGEETNKAIIRELSEGLQRGESIPNLARRIRDRVDHIGIHRARLMARTETMYALNEGTKTRYAQHGIEMVEWLTAWDERTCADCAALNGRVFKVSEAPPCPLHPNCRCTLLPIIEGSK